MLLIALTKAKHIRQRIQDPIAPRRTAPRRASTAHNRYGPTARSGHHEPPALYFSCAMQVLKLGVTKHRSSGPVTRHGHSFRLARWENFFTCPMISLTGCTRDRGSKSKSSSSSESQARFSSRAGCSCSYSPSLGVECWLGWSACFPVVSSSTQARRRQT